MSRPERIDAEPDATPFTPAGYHPARQAGWTRAEPSYRTTSMGVAWAPVHERADELADERVVRFMSAAGGYLALGAGYVATALLILR